MDSVWRNLTGDNDSNCSNMHRSGHSTVSIGKKIFLVGGATESKYCEMFVHELDTTLVDGDDNEHLWKVKQPLQQNRNNGRNIHTTLPPSRIAHSFDAVATSPKNHTIVLFGGWRVNKVLNDMWAFRTQNSKWTRIIPKGDVPSPRSNFCSAALHNSQKIVFFGGLGLKIPENLFNDTYMFSLGTKVFKKLKCRGSLPQPVRSACCSLSKKYKFFVFGGYRCTKLGSHYVTNELHMLNLRNLTWTKIDLRSSDVPPPRMFSVGGLVSKNNFLIFGGRGVNVGGKRYSDTWSFDLKNKRWERIFTRNKAVERSGHSGCVVDGSFYVFAGSHEWRLSSLMRLDNYKKVELLHNLRLFLSERRFCGRFCDVKIITQEN